MIEPSVCVRLRLVPPLPVCAAVDLLCVVCVFGQGCGMRSGLRDACQRGLSLW